MATGKDFKGDGRQKRAYATGVAASAAFPVAMPGTGTDDIGDSTLTDNSGKGIEWPMVINVERVQEITVRCYQSLAVASGTGTFTAFWHTPTAQNRVPSRTRADWQQDAAAANLADLTGASLETWKQGYVKKYQRNAGEIKGDWFYPSCAVATNAKDVLVIVELTY